MSEFPERIRFVSGDEDRPDTIDRNPKGEPADWECDYVRADLYAALQPVQCVTLTMEEADLVLRHYHQAFDDHGQADDCFLLMARIESEYLAWAETQGDVPR